MNNIIGQQAASLYQNTAKIATIAPNGADRDDQVSFGSMVKAGLGKVIDTQKTSEQVSAAALTGNATPIDVVQAVTEAEVVLQTAKSITTRVISAYQDVMRMPI
jgi:flagellar hook-basal body complex protein FliE